MLKKEIGKKSEFDVKLDMLESRIDYKEDYSRRNNLRFDGLDESPNEKWEETQVKIQHLFRDKLEIGTIQLERAHRMVGELLVVSLLLRLLLVVTLLMRSLLGSAGAFTALGGNPSVADGGARDPGAACALLQVAGSDDVREEKKGWENTTQRKVLEQLSGAGWALSSRDRYGGTPLLYAAVGGYVAAVQWLVQRGCDPRVQAKDGLTPLEAAVQCGSHEVETWLANNGGGILRSEILREEEVKLATAVEKGDEAGVRSALSMGARLDITVPTTLGAFWSLPTARILWQRMVKEADISRACGEDKPTDTAFTLKELQSTL
ncbi:hypothetical protein O3P69_018982 [Scylla paramamosain]|uniref:Uncharacterized protein n=1 Tax=Scylla paramamosain TaxID=85552 RepID=A0AAW0SA52_SCYPA